MMWLHPTNLLLYGVLARAHPVILTEVIIRSPLTVTSVPRWRCGAAYLSPKSSLTDLTRRHPYFSVVHHKCYPNRFQLRGQASGCSLLQQDLWLPQTDGVSPHVSRKFGMLYLERSERTRLLRYSASRFSVRYCNNMCAFQCCPCVDRI
jgi:hypothetical protein